MKIRNAANNDCKVLCELHKKSIIHFCSNYYTSKAIADWVASKNPQAYIPSPDSSAIIVGEHDNIIIGFGILNIAGESIDSLYLRPGTSGLGYGRAILLALEKIALQNNMKQLFLASTLNAENFYKHMGYEKCSNKMFKLRSGTELPCIEMKKTFKDNTQSVSKD